MVLFVGRACEHGRETKLGCEMLGAAEQRDTAAALQSLKRSDIFVYFVYFMPKLADSEMQTVLFGGRGERSLLLNCAVASDWRGNRPFIHVVFAGELVILSLPLLSSSCINDFITNSSSLAPPALAGFLLYNVSVPSPPPPSPLYLYPCFPLRAGDVTSRLTLPLRWNSFHSLAPGLIGRR